VGRAFAELGEISRAIAVMEEAVAWGHRSGFMVAQTQTRISLAALYGALGAIETGLAYTRQAAAIAAAHMPFFQAYAIAVEADMHLWRGELALAEERVTCAEQLARGMPHPLVAFALIGSRARVSLAQGNYAEALRVTDGAKEQLDTLSFRLFIPEMLSLRGQAFKVSGQIAEAQSVLQEARAVAEAMGARMSLWPILLRLAELETPEAAAALRAQAQTQIHFIAAHCPPDVRPSFLKLADVQQVLGLS
jgi:tetratricopeptide (TPR) repeat protein